MKSEGVYGQVVCRGGRGSMLYFGPIKGMVAVFWDAFVVVDSVAASQRLPVDMPRRGSGRKRGLTIDCIYWFDGRLAWFMK